jgi:predicted RNase H-like HicB family nuclease
MTARKRYVARAEHDGKWWAITVDDVPGAFSQVRRLTEAKETAREAISLVLDVPADSFDVSLSPKFEADVSEILRDLTEAKEMAREAQERLSAAMRLSVEALTRRSGLTVRDAAEVIGVSFQRVAQVASSITGKKKVH